jgi:hypothetical protein
VGLFYDNVVLLNLPAALFAAEALTSDLHRGHSDAAPARNRCTESTRNAQPSQPCIGMSSWGKTIGRAMGHAVWITSKNTDATETATRLPNRRPLGGFDRLFNHLGEYPITSAVEISLDRPIRSDLRFLASYTYSRHDADRPFALPWIFPDPPFSILCPEFLSNGTTRRNRSSDVATFSIAFADSMESFLHRGEVRGISLYTPSTVSIVCSVPTNGRLCLHIS